MIDTFDRVLLGGSLTLRCRALDITPNPGVAGSAAFPHGIDPGTQNGRPAVVVRHTDGRQFTSRHLRNASETLTLKLSRTAHRHSAGSAFNAHVRHL